MRIDIESAIKNILIENGPMESNEFIAKLVEKTHIAERTIRYKIKNLYTKRKTTWFKRYPEEWTERKDVRYYLAGQEQFLKAEKGGVLSAKLKPDYEMFKKKIISPLLKQLPAENTNISSICGSRRDDMSFRELSRDLGDKFFVENQPLFTVFRVFIDNKYGDPLELLEKFKEKETIFKTKKKDVICKIDTAIQRSFHVSPIPAWLKREIFKVMCLLYEQKMNKSDRVPVFENFIAKIKTENETTYCIISPGRDDFLHYQKFGSKNTIQGLYYKIPGVSSDEKRYQIEETLKKLPIKLLKSNHFYIAIDELYNLRNEMNSTLTKLRSMLEIYENLQSF